MAKSPTIGDAEDIRRLVEGMTEPALIVRGGMIGVSNAAARAVLGDWIEGQDVRLAIRHPAALERLLAAEVEPGVETDLVGVGGPERRWMMRSPRSPAAPGWSGSSTAARRMPPSGCASISSPMQATNCAPRSPPSSATPRRFANRPRDRPGDPGAVPRHRP